MKNTIKIIPLLIAAGAGFLFFNNNGKIISKNLSSPSQTCCESLQPTSQQIYVSLEIKTPEQVKNAMFLNHDLSRKLEDGQILNIDIMNDELNNIYSKEASANEIRVLKKYFKPTSTNDAALVRSVKRISDLAKQTGKQSRLDAILVTEGTNNPASINEIQHIAKEMESQKLNNVHIYVFGLSPANKLVTVAAFNPIKESMAGSCINEYSQCRSYLDNLVQ